MSRVILILFVVSLLSAGSGSADSQAANGGLQFQLSRGNELKGVSWAMMSEDGAHRLATIRVGRIFVEGERRGFLRIGLRPQVVAEDVTVTVEDLAVVAMDLELLFDRLNKLAGGRRLVVRNLGVVDSGGETSDLFENWKQEWISKGLQ